MSMVNNPLSMDDVATIERTFESAARMIATGDWAGWATLYAEDAILHPPHGPAVHGRQGLIEWGHAFPPVDDLRFFDVRLFGVGEVVYATSAYSLRLKGLPPDTGKQLAVIRRGPDGWTVLAVSFNSDLPLPGQA